MSKSSCKEVRDTLLIEWERFKKYSVKQVAAYIRYNFDCTEYTIKTLAKEFAGRP